MRSVVLFGMALAVVLAVSGCASDGGAMNTSAAVTSGMMMKCTGCGLEMKSGMMMKCVVCGKDMKMACCNDMMKCTGCGKDMSMTKCKACGMTKKCADMKCNDCMKK